VRIVRFLQAGHEPRVGRQDGDEVRALPVPSLAALLARPLSEIKDLADRPARLGRRAPGRDVAARTRLG
jgi:hypothetical protein